MNEMAHPKYSQPEIERRWLIDELKLPDLASCPCRQITDKYISHSRLRLRRVQSEQKETVYKLCKKYGKTVASEPIVNIYLTEEEDSVFDQLPGYRVG